MTASITITLSEQDLINLRKIAKATNRRFNDFKQLIFAEGLEYFFTEEHVMIKRDDNEIEKDELDQIILNEKLMAEPGTNMDQMKDKGYVSGVSRYLCNDYGSNDDKLIRPIIERLRSSACD